MKALKIQVIEYIDDWNPGWVKCEFKDVHGKTWSFIEKVPVVSIEALDSKSNYPIETYIECEVISQSSNVVTINLEKPLGIIAEDQTIFDVFEDQIINSIKRRR